MTGTATDNTAIGNVELSIEDMNTGKWWNPSNSSWETANSRSILAGWTSNNAPATFVNWRYTFTGVSAGGVYLLQVKTRDFNGNLSQFAQRTFGMPGTTPPPPPPPPALDTTRPDGTLTFPTVGAQLPYTTVEFAGQATDNVGVTSVRVALRRLSDGRWWNGSATGSGFSTGFAWFETTLDTPGGLSTGWTWPWTPRAAGNYRILVQARDGAGNTDNSMPNVDFTVTSSPPDTVAPDTVLSTPTEGESFPTGPVSITGSATDNIAVDSVQVRIVNGGGEYWTGSGWSTLDASVNATLASPGAAATNWSYSFIAPSNGAYTVTATAVDTSFVADPSPAGPVGFSTFGSADTTDPDQTVVTSPAGGSSGPSPLTITGTASDNVGVTEVRVAIRLNPTTTWWNGSSFGTYTYVLATLDNPGGTTTGWSYTFAPPASGSFGLQTRAVDAAANVGANSTWRSFSVSTGGPSDTTNPGQAVVTSPAGGSSTSTTVTIEGTATDDVGVTLVRVAIRLNPTTTWWNGSSFGPYTYVFATLDNPGGTSTGWSYTFTPPSTGNYGLQVRAVDAAGNLGANSIWRSFNIT